MLTRHCFIILFLTVLLNYQLYSQAFGPDSTGETTKEEAFKYELKYQLFRSGFKSQQAESIIEIVTTEAPQNQLEAKFSQPTTMGFHDGRPLPLSSNHLTNKRLENRFTSEEIKKIDLSMLEAFRKAEYFLTNSKTINPVLLSEVENKYLDQFDLSEEELFLLRHEIKENYQSFVGTEQNFKILMEDELTFLQIITEPSLAKTWVNGKEWRETNSLTATWVGKKNIVIKMEGYEDETGSIMLEKGKKGTFKRVLKKKTD